MSVDTSVDTCAVMRVDMCTDTCANIFVAGVRVLNSPIPVFGSHLDLCLNMVRRRMLSTRLTINVGIECL